MRFEFHLERSEKRFLAAALVPLVLGAAAVAYAAPAHTWNDGDTLTAMDLNQTFTDLDTKVSNLDTKASNLDAKTAMLDGRVTTLEAPAAPPTYLESTSNTSEVGQFGQDIVYQSVSLSLTPGTWLVQGFATLETTGSPDAVGIVLWDDGSAAEIAGSRSPVGLTAPPGACSLPNGVCGLVASSTSSVVTVMSPMTVKIKALRNGSSTLRVGNVDQALVMPVNNRLTAVKLR